MPDHMEFFLLGQLRRMAVVVDSAEEVYEYFEEEGIDIDGADEEEILDAESEFYNRRTAGEPLEKLRVLTGDNRYESRAFTSR